MGRRVNHLFGLTLQKKLQLELNFLFYILPVCDSCFVCACEVPYFFPYLSYCLLLSVVTFHYNL